MDVEEALRVLTPELEFFEAHRIEFCAQALGKFAVIKDQKLHGFYDTEEEAYDAAGQMFGGEPCLIQDVLPEDPVLDFPALRTGLMHAHF